MIPNRMMSLLMSTAIIAGLTACCCPINFNPGKGPVIHVGPKIPQPPPRPELPQVDPAEKPVIDALYAAGGWAIKENGSAVDVTIAGGNEEMIRQVLTLPNMRKLKFKDKQSSVQGLEILANHPTLEHLELWGTKIDDEGLKQVAKISRLKYVGLRGTKVTDSGLANLEPLKQLEEIDIAGGNATNTAGVIIAKHLPSVQKILMDNSGFGDTGLDAVCTMPNIKYLQFYGSSVTDAGLASLQKSKTLEHVALGSSTTNNGMKAVALCKSLQFVSVFNARVSDKGIEHLHGMPNLTRLEIRNGVFGGVTNEGVAAFIKANPKCSVIGP